MEIPFLALMLDGAWITVQASLTAYGIGLFIGVLLAAAKLSQYSWLCKCASLFATMIRGLPELLMLFLIYYGLTRYLNTTMPELNFSMSPFWAGVSVFAVIVGAYSSEVFRGAILAVPQDDVEAAKAFGMSDALAFRRIILPQAFQHALPGLGNLFIVLTKDTSLLSVIGLAELMRAAQLAISYTKEPFTYYMLAALMYLCMTITGILFFKLLQTNWHRRAGYH